MWNRSKATECLILRESDLSFLLKFTALYLRNCPITLLAFPQNSFREIALLQFFSFLLNNLFLYLFSFQISWFSLLDFFSFTNFFILQKFILENNVDPFKQYILYLYFQRWFLLCTVTIFLAQLTTFPLIQLQKRMLLMLYSFFTFHNLCQFPSNFCTPSWQLIICR